MVGAHRCHLCRMFGYFRHPLRACVFALVVGLGMVLPNFDAAAMPDRPLTLDQVVAPTADGSGPHGDGHACECLPACGGHCQALLPGEIEAVTSHRRNFHDGTVQRVGDRIKSPEPGPPRSHPLGA